MTDEDYLIVPNLTMKQLTRLFSYIKIGLPNGCWEYVGFRNPKGYGMIPYKQRHEFVHRLVYALLVGPIPRGRKSKLQSLELDHFICNNPPCCNPAHLRLVTPKENNLRGNGPCARNARRTHCVNGHPLPKEPNRIENGKRRRRCLTCERESDRKRQPRKYIPKTLVPNPAKTLEAVH